MATIDQTRVVSGFDVEAMLGAEYIRKILQTAFDAGVIPSSAVFGGTKVFLRMLQEDRLYEPEPDAEGNLPATHPEAFKTRILFDHPLGADLHVRLIAQRENDFPVPFDLFVQFGMNVARQDGAVESANLVLHVVDIDSPALALLEPEVSKEEVLAATQEFVDRSIDLGSASSFQRIEAIDFQKLAGDDQHDDAIGFFINVRLRNGDEDDQFLPPRGARRDALNFLPAGEDIAFASRPGMYDDLGLDVFSRTAIRNSLGVFEHALRPNILNPNSKRIGDVERIRVGQIAKPIPVGGDPFDNGLRVSLEGEYVDPENLTNTDVRFTVDIRPVIDDDGILQWNTDLDVDVDALFEFITFWAATMSFILFGPIGAGVIFGLALVGQIGAGIFFGEYFETKAVQKADATLADVIPDRLTIETRRWDPFYATQHQVVTKPSQAEFNAQGFLLCGKAFVGRSLVPPNDTVIRDEIRDDEGKITALRYRFDDFQKIQSDSGLHAVGAHRRPFTAASDDEPSLFPLTLEQIRARVEDADGPLVLKDIPYFPAYVYIRGNQINQLLCLSGTELQTLRNQLREEKIQEHAAAVEAERGEQLLQEVIDDLNAELGPDDDPPTQEAIDAEYARRLRKEAKALLGDYESPTPLQMAHNGMLRDLVRFDLRPSEILDLRDREIIAVDTALSAIEPREITRHLRDRARHGEEESKDNLMERPRFRPGDGGPEFPD